MILFLFVFTCTKGKLATLIRFLTENQVKKGLVFLPTCACVEYWGAVLPKLFPKSYQVPLLALHGKMKEKRSKVLDSFRKSQTAILLATDLLARGIDVPEVKKYITIKRFLFLFVFCFGRSRLIGCCSGSRRPVPARSCIELEGPPDKVVRVLPLFCCSNPKKPMLISSVATRKLN